MLYLPTLKTSDAELRAVKHLSDGIKKQMCPIFELTRSRKTKKDPQGSLLKRIEQVKEIHGHAPAIIDLTVEEALINPEMDLLFDEANGYDAWCIFAEVNFPASYIPCLQFSEGSSIQNFRQQASRLLQSFPKVALRLSVTDLEATELYEEVYDEIGHEKLILIANVKFVEHGMLNYSDGLCVNFLKNVVGNRIPNLICFPSSGFPRAVGSGDYGNDRFGSFPALEISLFNKLSAQFPSLPIAYSDFGSVHPIRYEAAFSNWVPRVDIPLDGNYSYTRIRRGEGGYAAAARLALAKYGNDLTNCWGTEQIRLAAAGTPPGSNPSFWISVRINMWITEQVERLSASLSIVEDLVG
jgi:hypothetical protein